jgi:predicted DNA-binding protein
MRLLFTFAIISLPVLLVAQDLTALQYMQHIGKVERALSMKYLSYMSAASHGRSKRKIDKRREDLINSINESRMKINELPAFNGDKTIRDSAVNYLKILYRIFNEDYEKLVNMEEIAEQSYDAMEAYMLAEQKAGEKLKEAAGNYQKTTKEFAGKYNVKLIDSESELEQKVELATKIQEYYSAVYLVFFKPYKQELYFLDALNSKNANGMEQNRSSLLKYADEGLVKLKGIKGVVGDKSIESACRRLLDFYKDEAEKHFPAMTDFYLKVENFEKIKSAFETSAKAKADVDKYNKALTEINRAADQYNRTNERLNQQRNDLLNNYNFTVKTFMDTHMPYAR